jgi:hypothetical protein
MQNKRCNMYLCFIKDDHSRPRRETITPDDLGPVVSEYRSSPLPKEREGEGRK